MAAVAAAQVGRRVVVLEQLRRPGLKLLATGGGRCNLTHDSPPEDYVAAFGRQGRFVLPALSAMDPAELRQFFEGLGVSTHVEEGGLIFPNSNSARSVQSALLRRCEELGVQVLCECRVERMEFPRQDVSDTETQRYREEGKTNSPASSSSSSASLRLCVVSSSSSEPLVASTVIIATGGKGYSELGGTGGGYELARQVGHEITPLYPALVPLLCREDWPKSCAGIAIQGRIWLDLRGRPKQESVGGFIFTQRGISGPAVLNLSGLASQAIMQGEEITLHLSLHPSRSKGEWVSQIELWRHKQGSRRIGKLMSDMLPARLVEAVTRQCGLNATASVSQLTGEQQATLVDMLSDAKLTLIGTEGWEQAMVTGGGVALKQVDPQTMQSRLWRGLYFAGEVLDLHGPSGGYNLQWAFSSGHLAGRSAIS
jgi:predicted Rossmann fold flavoprotein